MNQAVAFSYRVSVYKIRDILSLGMITVHKSCNMLKFNFCGEKSMQCLMYVKTDSNIIL